MKVQMKVQLPLAKALGRIEPSAELLAYAKQAGDDFWTNQVADAFSDQVDVWGLPAFLGRNWVPSEALAKLGLGLKYPDDGHWADIVLTTGVDYHTDQAGPTLIWTLRNDRFRFSQRGVQGSIEPVVGDWFLFEAGRHHKMDLSPKDAKKEGLVFVGVSVELERLKETLVCA